MDIADDEFSCMCDILKVNTKKSTFLRIYKSSFMFSFTFILDGGARRRTARVIWENVNLCISLKFQLKYFNNGIN